MTHYSKKTSGQKRFYDIDLGDDPEQQLCRDDIGKRYQLPVSSGMVRRSMD